VGFWLFSSPINTGSSPSSSFLFFNIFHQVHFKRESYWDGYFIGWNIRIYRVAATRRLRATFILGQSFAANY